MFIYTCIYIYYIYTDFVNSPASDPTLETAAHKCLCCLLSWTLLDIQHFLSDAKETGWLNSLKQINAAEFQGIIFCQQGFTKERPAPTDVTATSVLVISWPDASMFLTKAHMPSSARKKTTLCPASAASWQHRFSMMANATNINQLWRPFRLLCCYCRSQDFFQLDLQRGNLKDVKVWLSLQIHVFRRQIVVALRTANISICCEMLKWAMGTPEFAPKHSLVT